MVSFRRSKKFGPFRITAGKSGLGVSGGAGPLRVSRSAKGRYSRTVRVPGTGIFDTKRLGSGPGRSSSGGAPQQSARSRTSAVGGLAAVALGGILVVGLANCGGQDESTVSPATTSSSSAVRTTTSSPSSSTSTTASSSAPQAAVEDAGSPEAALRDRDVAPAPVNVPVVPAAPAPAPAPLAEPAPAPQPAPEYEAPSVSTYYANCAAVRAAGAAPIYADSPGYGTHLDRDRDGIGCDKG